MLNMGMGFFTRINPSISEKYNNQTLYWAGSDTIENFERYQPNPYNQHSITYKLNEYGFRSDSFVFDNYRLVFLGCSFVEGAGLPLEETFSYIIHNEIQKRIGKKIPYWNLGLGGCGLDTISRLYYNLEELLKPQVVISLFPEYRIEYFFNENKCEIAAANYDNQIFVRNPILTNPYVISYSIEKNLAILDLLFQKNHTLSIWDTWDHNNFDRTNILKLRNFQNYLNVWKKIVEQTKDYPLARDGMHPGKQTNFEFAKTILDCYGDEICERLTK